MTADACLDTGAATGKSGMPAPMARRHESLWRSLYRARLPYLFISPFFILYAIFGIYPAFYALILSFHDWAGRGDWTFVGLGNYLRLWTIDPVFRATMVSTAEYLAVIVPAMTFSALILAVLLNSKAAACLGGFYRTTLILPYVLAPTVISVVFLQIYDPTYGWLNLPLRNLGVPTINWLGSEDWSLWAIVLVMLWQFVGYNTVIALAGLTGISPEVYDAARVDGCSAVREFWFITIPLMRPTLLFMAVMSTIGVLNMFAQPWLLTHGGPGYSSNTLGIMLYRTAFEFGKYGYAAAIGITIFALSGAFSFLQMRLSRAED